MKPGDFPDLNSDNIRSLREADDIEIGDFNIILLGDSYVYGYALSEDEAPPAQLEALLREYYGTERINVWNFGWTSSSPYLSLRLLKDIGRKYQPHLVVLNLDMTDFKDDFFYRSVLERQGLFHYFDRFPALVAQAKFLTYRWSFLGSLHERWFGYPAENDYFVTRQPMKHSRLYFDTVLESLAQLHQYSRDELGVPFVVFFPPRHWQYTDREAPNSWERGGFDELGPYALEPFYYFDAVRADLPYAFVPLLEDFRQSEDFPLNFRADSHWNPLGARVAAQMMFRHCLALGCFQVLDETLPGRNQPLAPVPPLP